MKKHFFKLSTYLFSTVPLIGIIGLISFRSNDKITTNNKQTIGIEQFTRVFTSLPCGYPNKGIVPILYPTFNTSDVQAILAYPGGGPLQNPVPNTISSGDGRTYLILQGDGNLVLYEATQTGWKPCWDSGTVGSHAVTMWFQRDGNLVLRNSSNQWVWGSQIHSTCDGSDFAFFTIQNDGNMVMRYPTGNNTLYALGDTNTQNQQRSSWNHRIQ